MSHSKPPDPELLRRLPLTLARTLIDRIDAAILALAAARRMAVGLAASAKPPGTRDPVRETQVHEHARIVATDLGLPIDSAEALVTLLITDACRQQGLATHRDDGASPRSDPYQGEPQPLAMKIPIMDTEPLLLRIAARLPPPSIWAPWMSRLPRPAGRVQAGLEWLVSRALASGDLAFLEGRTIGIEVTDLGLSPRFGLRDGQPRVVSDPAEATVRGTLTDLLQLASRREDADTLFFQRRLMLTGDTELGLHTRNVLDRIDWQAVPLALRIPLHRVADWTARVRTLHYRDGSWTFPGPSRQ
ncbi:MAG: SCP2 sterol-binding domain-containing protein [Ahniella sp.]|nr:SCP2 sterol-binding domain-containing protein [Ahniella sp.]